MTTSHPRSTSSSLSFHTPSRQDLYRGNEDEGFVSIEADSETPPAESSLAGKKPVPRRSVFSEAGLITNTSWNGRSLFEVFDRAAELHPERQCLGFFTPETSPPPLPPSPPHRVESTGSLPPQPGFRWETYSQVKARALSIGSGLMELGLSSGSLVGMAFRPHSVSMVMDLACLAFAFVSVLFHEAQPANELQELLYHSGVSVLVTDEPTLLGLLPGMGKNAPELKNIILVGEIREDLLSAVSREGKNLTALIEVETQGRLAQHEGHGVKGEDLVSIVYTAGTTDPPKGVLLTNRNFLAVFGGLEELARHHHLPHFSKGDIFLSNHSHAFTIDRVLSFAVLSAGGAVSSFTTGDILQDLSLLKPTLAFLAAHELCRLHQQLLATSGKKVTAQGMLMDLVIRHKVRLLRQGADFSSFYDKLLFKKIRTALGPRLRALMVGDAPCPLHVLDYFRTTLDRPMFEFYGLTEGTGISSVSRPFDYAPRQVGPPLPCNEISLVTEKGSKGALKGFPTGVGELHIRGANMSPGYFKEDAPEQAGSAKEEWVRTGDLGIWDERGRLRIYGHRSNLIRLSTDDIVFPERLESLYSESRWVHQILVYGESEADFLVALVIPDRECVEAWVREHRIPGEGMADWMRNPKIKAAVFKDLSRIATRGLFQPLERLRDIVLHHEQFTKENMLLGPTGKLVRLKVKSRHFAILKEIMEWNQRPSPL